MENYFATRPSYKSLGIFQSKGEKYNKHTLMGTIKTQNTKGCCERSP
jgi:hypothetical protein